MRDSLARIWGLTRRAVFGSGAGIGLLMAGIALALIGVELWVDVKMIAWTRRFYDAVEQMETAAAMRELGVFAVLVTASAAIFLTSDYLRKRLRLRWRQKLTGQALDRWTGGKAYWHLRPGLSAVTVDNPDQRIAEDCDRFVALLLLLTLDLVGRIAGVVTYIAILWTLSDFVLSFSLFGVGIEIPRYMVWLALLYVLVSSLITHAVGWPLKSLYFRHERREADFRHSLVQVRDNATEIAQSGGEAAERRRLDARFEGIRHNWLHLIRRELILGLFTRPYYQTVLRVPLFFALPAYFAGSVTFGGLMQLSGTFSRVTTTLSWFIFQYKELAEFAAVSHRLDELFRATGDPEPVAGAVTAIERTHGGDVALRVSGLTLATPEGRWLAPVPDRVIRPGERIWISGASGQGKTTLLAAITGLWRYGEGRIDMPTGRMIVLPQRPHLFSDGLAAAACYPSDPADVPPDRLRSVLERLGLTHRLGALSADGPDDGDAALEGLSLGERQRLALARVLLHRPDWVILDEATSSLDAASEAHLLALLRRELPRAAILCVAHRDPVGLDPTGTWFIGEVPQDERKTA
ncbi:SbmA/BacA-like family transporter [Roseicyclus sp. F158]|uniref:SbmA/BacA-like family transporter n=1 Tax=Tropicimonas omnivorans TaxID=3075590 RepID=A0ABU3DH36_9RHOB|nr:SbmA/BacA-like family transporter [Roseicyclus sp. F158]MDT0683019.1 SbmA/BacA-like family transporter [Roseicyclus sp. F158]